MESATLTPAGQFTDKTASDIYDALHKQDEKDGILSPFANKKRVMEAIHDLAEKLHFRLKKRVRKKG
jgi:hypothetical protein